MFQVEYKSLGLVWYAMKASYGKALKAKETLDDMQVECYVPMRYEKRKINGRNKIIPVAAIPNLIFIKTDLNYLNDVKMKMDYLHNMLIKSVDGNLLEPIIIPELDMSHFMTVVRDVKENVKFVDVEINKMIIDEGARVRITEGRYKGFEGILCRPKGSRARKVLIDLCGLAPVEMPAVQIELLQKI